MRTESDMICRVSFQGGVIGWILRGCLAMREAVLAIEAESDDSEPERTVPVKEVSRKATTWWVTSEGRGRCLHVRPDCSTLNSTRSLTQPKSALVAGLAPLLGWSLAAQICTGI